MSDEEIPKTHRFPPLPALVPEKRSKQGVTRGLVPSADHAESDEPYTAYLEGIDPRSNPETQHALAAATDVRFRQMLNLMNEPRYQKRSLVYLAKVLDIGLSEFTDFMRKASHTRALGMAAQALPNLVEDLAQDARSRKEMCERCDGFGYLEVPEERLVLEEGKPINGKFRPLGAKWVRDCPACDGNGTLRKEGNSHARDKILAINGIGGKNGGVTVAINNYAGMGIESAGNSLGAVTFDVGAEEIEGEE